LRQFDSGAVGRALKIFPATVLPIRLQIGGPLVHGARIELYDEAGRRKYLNGAERERFLARADRCTPGECALLYVLTYTGCRISEALALTGQHLDRERDTITVRTLKRRRTVFRTIPVPPEVTELLLRLHRPPDDVFWTMHRATAWRLVHATMEAANISGPMACCKGLRHAFGMRAADRNVPPSLIQRWMGHASPATTAIYIDAVGIEERGFASRMW
jgi:integrase